MKQICFYSHPGKLVIEVDGEIHEDKDKKEYDIHRRKVFENRGLHEMRFKNREIVSDIENVIKDIKEYVENICLIIK